MRITGTVAEWEAWTGMAFPESGDYVFPEGLAPVHDRPRADLGTYWEPNVWMVHPEIGELVPVGPQPGVLAAAPRWEETQRCER